MDLIKKYWNNELFKASFILLILLNVANVLNYLFHFIMGRMLGPADYGILATLTSLIYIFTVPTAAIQTLVSRHTTRLNVKQEFGKIKGMFKILLIEAIILGIILFALFSACAFFLSDILAIPLSLLILTGTFIFAAVISPIAIGILQGMKKFSVWGWNTILNSAIKLALAILLVILGFGVYGPILGFVLGIFLSLLFIFPYIREVMKSKAITEKIAIISRENISLLCAMLIMTLMYSLDILFAKSMFPAEIAGKYSVASMIGKMIFFGAASISGAMFPISSERFFKKTKQKNGSVFRKTFLIIAGLCAIAAIALLIFPKFIISILFGSKYLDIYGIMFYLGVAFSFLSLTNTYVLYKISIYEFRIRHAIALFVFLAVQIAALIFYSEDLAAFSIAFMISTIITFLGSIIFISKSANK